MRLAHIPNRTEPVNAKMSADVVVIGSGPGGSIAATLCAEAGKSVLLIEEGQNLSLQSTPHFSQLEILHKYRNAGINVALGATKVAYVEGRCVGGGSEINRGLYHRTPSYVLESWSREFGVRDLTLDSLTPHFIECEKTARVEYLPDSAPLISTRLRDGATNLGWAAIEAPRLYCYGKNAGAGKKQSISETFVPRFIKAGGRMIADTVVTRVLRSGNKWQINAKHSPEKGALQTVEVIAEKVFVSCGAVQTPALLRRSGFTRNIGNSLRFHPMLKVVGQFADDVNNPGDLDPVHQITEFEPRFGMGCSISKRPMLGMAMANHRNHFAEVGRNWKRMGLYYVQTSGGKAKVRNIPFFRDPLVLVRHSLYDLQTFAEGLKRLAEALFAAGAVAVYPCVPDYPVLKSTDDIRRLPDIISRGDGSLTSVHVFSSCPMGENEAMCATDSFGRVHGADGLYIADASLLCGPTAVNPQGTVMAIVHRNVSHIIENRFA
jgi:choline dehydrogenase-like flavoprotein